MKPGIRTTKIKFNRLQGTIIKKLLEEPEREEEEVKEVCAASELTSLPFLVKNTVVSPASRVSA